MQWVYEWLQGLERNDKLFYNAGYPSRGNLENYKQVYMDRVCWNPRNDYTNFNLDRFLVQIKMGFRDVPIKVRADALAPFDESVWGAMLAARKAREYFDLFSKGQQASALKVFGTPIVSRVRNAASDRGSSVIELPTLTVRHDLFLAAPPTDKRPQAISVPLDTELVDFTEVENGKRPSSKPDGSDIPF